MGECKRCALSSYMCVSTIGCHLSQGALVRCRRESSSAAFLQDKMFCKEDVVLRVNSAEAWWASPRWWTTRGFVVAEKRLEIPAASRRAIRARCNMQHNVPCWDFSLLSGVSIFLK